MNPRMEMIVAVDRSWAIGRKNRLLASIPQDQKQFREKTMGNVVIMGRKTLESLPGGQPLFHRVNLILSRNPEYQVKGAQVVHSQEELFEVLEEYEKQKIFVAGGGEIYRLLLPFTDVVHVTKIFNSYEADTFFPNLDEDGAWQLVAESEEQTCFDLEYRFYQYERKK